MTTKYGVKTSARFPRLDRGWSQWRKIRREYHRLRKALAAGREPIIVYSHPKTASRSVEAALAASPDHIVTHCHVLRPQHFTRAFEPTSGILAGGMVRHAEPTQWALREHLLDQDRPTRIVTLVRDPVATSISWLYFGLQRWLASWRPIDPQCLTDDAWIDIFRTRYPQFGLWSWWEDEFLPVTGIDPRRDGFDAARGWTLYEGTRMQVLVMSTHLDDADKTAALQSIFGSKVAPVERRNVSAERAGDAQYERVKRLISQDREYCRTLLDHDWSHVFFTDDQRREFSRRWNCD